MRVITILLLDEHLRTMPILVGDDSHQGKIRPVSSLAQIDIS